MLSCSLPLRLQPRVPQMALVLPFPRHVLQYEGVLWRAGQPANLEVQAAEDAGKR